MNVSKQEYDGMLHISQELTTRRLDLIATSLAAVKWLSPVLFVVGMTLTLVGVKRWSRKQARLDEIDQLEIDERKARVRPIEKSEYRAKAEEEVRKDAAPESPKSHPVADTPANQSSPQIKPDNETLASQLVELESLFFEKFDDYNSFDYRVQQNVRFADKYEADILLAAYNRNKHQDKLVEVKYFQTKLSMEAVIKAREQLQKAMNYYHNSTRRSVQSVLIVAYKEGIAGADELERFRTAVAGHSRPPGLTILVLADTQIPDFDIKSLIS